MEIYECQPMTSIELLCQQWHQTAITIMTLKREQNASLLRNNIYPMSAVDAAYFKWMKHDCLMNNFGVKSDKSYKMEAYLPVFSLP